MTPANIIAWVDDYGFQDTDSTAKTNALNAAIRSIAYREPWPFMQAVSTLTFDGTNAFPASGPVNLGTDMRAVMKIIDTSSGERISYMPVEDVEEKFGSQLTLQGTPAFFYFEGTQLRLWPVPPATTSLRLRTLKTHPTVASTDPESAILIPKDFHENVLVPRMLVWLYLMEDDPDLASPQKALADEGIAQMETALFAQQYDEPEYVHVIDIDDYDYDW